MKFLPDNDFRSRRLILEPDDFALGPEEPDNPPSDLLDESTWRSMTSLQDDVSVRTSNDHGSLLKSLWECWSEWSCLVGALQALTTNPADSPLCNVACNVGDEFQSSICNALVGFYRVAFSGLRNVLEHMSIGLQLELASDSTLFQSWLNGDTELGLGWAADLLRSHARVLAIENHCQRVIGDDFFHQRTPTDKGGIVRRLFKRYSQFTHGAPGFTDADIRDSTGPIFVPQVFLSWATSFKTVYSIALIEAKLGQPALGTLAFGSALNAEKLFQQIVSELPATEDGVSGLTSLPSGFWQPRNRVKYRSQI
jgi:hypothetical protein